MPVVSTLMNGLQLNDALFMASSWMGTVNNHYFSFVTASATTTPVSSWSEDLILLRLWTFRPFGAYSSNILYPLVLIGKLLFLIVIDIATGICNERCHASIRSIWPCSCWLVMSTFAALSRTLSFQAAWWISGLGYVARFISWIKWTKCYWSCYWCWILAQNVVPVWSYHDVLTLLIQRNWLCKCCILLAVSEGKSFINMPNLLQCMIHQSLSGNNNLARSVYWVWSNVIIRTGLFKGVWVLYNCMQTHCDIVSAWQCIQEVTSQ